MKKRLCVFAGASAGIKTEYIKAAEELAQEMVSRDIELVYGGAKLGLMGVLADTVLANGGHVIGIIPKALTAKEIVHDGLSELQIVESMHERKAQMESLASYFVSLPGGIGTLEEMIEILTWAQLGIHEKACGLVNVHGYYDYLEKFLDQMIQEGFLKSKYKSLLIIADSSKQFFDHLDHYERPLPKRRWSEDGLLLLDDNLMSTAQT